MKKFIFISIIALLVFSSGTKTTVDSPKSFGCIYEERLTPEGMKTFECCETNGATYCYEVK